MYTEVHYNPALRSLSTPTPHTSSEAHASSNSTHLHKCLRTHTQSANVHQVPTSVRHTHTALDQGSEGGGSDETGEAPGSATQRTVPSLLLYCQLVNCGVYHPSYTNSSHTTGQVSAIPLGHLGVPETSPKSQRLRHSFLGPRRLQNTLSGTPAPTLLEPPLRDTQTLCP